MAKAPTGYFAVQTAKEPRRTIALDVESRELTVDGTFRAKLPQLSAALLEGLMRRPGTILNNEAIIGLLWPDDDEPDSSVEIVRIALFRIREALKKAGIIGLISTVYGRGYQLEASRQHMRVLTAAQAQVVDEVLAEEDAGPTALSNDASSMKWWHLAQ